MNYPGSPYHPSQDYYYGSGSPSPTPSPRHNQFYPPQTPQRPQTRAHFRQASADYQKTFSPRYTSTGEYATGPLNVSSSRKHSFSRGSPTTPKRERRHSHSYYRASYGDSDEDEVIDVNGVRFVIPAQARWDYGEQYYNAPGRHGTDYNRYSQGPAYDKERTPYYPEDPIPRSATRLGGHARRPSGSVPHRPSTTRPGSSHKKAPPPRATATEADAKRHKIPAGYSLKNWDPNEEPIILLGSVFDCNSLGKWIYDWTVHRHGAGTPIAEVSGDLWLLLINLSGKIGRAEQCVPSVRSKENRKMLEDFIDGGYRLTDKLRSLLKKCEAPMLRATDKHKGPSRAGVEFVETLFGRDRELDKTNVLMQQIRTWNLRFDVNCDPILKHPTR